MADLRNPRLINAKGFLFLLCGVLASVLLLLELPTLKAAFLLAVAVWGFARFYYFAFYVIEHYVDPGYRFAGLWSFACYLVRRRPHRVDQLGAPPGNRPPAGTGPGGSADTGP